MLQISKDASPYAALVLGPGGRRKRREETGEIRAHPLAPYFAPLLDLHMSDSPIVSERGCSTPRARLGREALLALSHGVCHPAGCARRRESRDRSAAEQGCSGDTAQRHFEDGKRRGRLPVLLLVLTGSKNSWEAGTWQMRDYVKKQ